MSSTTPTKKIKKFKVFKFTYDEVAKPHFEDKVNKEIVELQEQGKEIVTTSINTMGLSPMLYMVTVVYIEHISVEQGADVPTEHKSTKSKEKSNEK